MNKISINFKFCFFVVFLNLNFVLSEIVVFKEDKEKPTKVFTDYELSIGSDIPDEGVLAYIVVADPKNACSEIKPPPTFRENYLKNDTFLYNQTNYKWFVLVDRDYCGVEKKLKNVIDAGYDGIIIYNAKLALSINSEFEYLLTVDIPVLLVTHIDGKQIASSYTYDLGYSAIIKNNSPFKIYPYLIPFLFVIGVCIIVIISFIISQIYGCYNESKKRRKNRLAKRHLKKIPTINFKKGDHYEICAICLDDFQENMKLRILPCGHAYHLKCIDPWLTKNRRNCPICKGKVIVPGMTESEDSEEETTRNNNATERTPLISSQQNENLFYSNLIIPLGRQPRQNRSSRQNSSLPASSRDVSININSQNTNNPQNAINPPQRVLNSSRRSRRQRMNVNAEINPQSPLPSYENDQTLVIEHTTGQTVITQILPGNSTNSNNSSNARLKRQDNIV